MVIGTKTLFRSYDTTDLERCLGLFDSNCPEFFAPNERDEYRLFLTHEPLGYEVCLVEQRIVGAYGLTVIGQSVDEQTMGRVSWILIDPKTQGMGVGSAMMHRAVERARNLSLRQINIAASHLSEPFFEKFGATTVATLENGWGVDMHRHDMTLRL